MNRVVAAVAALFLVFLVTVAGLIGYAAVVGPELDASSKAYVDEAVPRIIANWSVDELLSRGAPRIRDTVDLEQLRAVFGRLSALGPMVSYDGAKGTSRMAFTPADGRVVGAVYLARATFEKGRAEIRVSLLQVGGQWRIQGFSVNSPLLHMREADAGAAVATVAAASGSVPAASSA
jgi:hypothetical protein